MHTYCLMSLSPAATTSIYSKLKATCRKIWKLPIVFPKAGLHAPHDELGPNLPTTCEDYCSDAINSWTYILNDQGALRATVRASLTQANTKKKNWLLELAFYAHRGGRPLCPSIIARNIASLIAADLHPLRCPEIWSGNQLSATLTSSIPITIDEDGCPTINQPYTRTSQILCNLTPLWEHNVHTRAQAARISPNARPYFLSEAELIWTSLQLAVKIFLTLQKRFLYCRKLMQAESPDHINNLTHNSSTPDPRATSITTR